MAPKAVVKVFHEPDSHTAQYVVHCPETRECVLIDSVAVFDTVHGSFQNGHLDEIFNYVETEKLHVKYILETHCHADHVSGAPLLKERYQAPLCIGSGITAVQSVMSHVFDLHDVNSDGSQFDILWNDNQEFDVGSLRCRVLHTPGHTPACVSYYFIDDAVFVGDTIFMPDMGTARCDFPGGSSRTLWNSIQRLLSLPDDVRVFTCHDYAPDGREYKFESTIAEQKANNKHVKTGTEEEQFVTWRAERDKQLTLPRLIMPSIQLNIRAGHLPPVNENGIAYIKIPLNQRHLFTTGNAQ